MLKLHTNTCWSANEDMFFFFCEKNEDMLNTSIQNVEASLRQARSSPSATGGRGWTTWAWQWTMFVFILYYGCQIVVVLIGMNMVIYYSFAGNGHADIHGYPSGTGKGFYPRAASRAGKGRIPGQRHRRVNALPDPLSSLVGTALSMTTPSCCSIGIKKSISHINLRVVTKMIISCKFSLRRVIDLILVE